MAKQTSGLKPTVYTVKPSEHGSTLMQLLADRLHISRKRAKQILDSRNVLVNGQRVWMARHELRRRDEIQVLVPVTEATQSERVKILLDENGYVVASKPPGMLATGKRSIETALQRQLDCPTLCAVHRLDKDTSGCIVLARSEKAFEDAVEGFREHRVRKVYHAIVEGHVGFESHTLRTPLEGRDAITKLRCVDANREASHLLIGLETGRKHQIRKHMRQMRHPILGDKTYAVGREVEGAALSVTRQMLHAYTIELTIPRTETKIRATARLPRDFRRVLKTYKLT